MQKADSEAYHLIQNIIQKLNVNLTGKIVLTEIGTGAFKYIGLIAALAGAKKVLLWTKDSPYGASADNIKSFEILWRDWQPDSQYEIAINERPTSHINAADIVTNSGFLRPIDTTFIKNLKTSAVIAYMAEAWEYRHSDIDIESCHASGIKVAGTWENHPDLKIFDHCGPLALKMLTEANIDITHKKMAILSNDHFGDVIKTAAKDAYTDIIQIDRLNTIDFKDFDVIFIADYSTELTLLGKDGLLKPHNIRHCRIVHLCGTVDVAYCQKEKLNVWPLKNGESKKMTFTLAHLGLKPVIDLHGAGLKVGELLHNHKNTNLVQIM